MGLTPRRMRPMTPDQEKWTTDLVAFARKCHEQNPPPARASLTAEEEQQCRVLGGHLISWLEEWGPALIAERNVLAPVQGCEKDPHVVYLTEGPGLVAAHEILQGAEEQITWLTPTEFEDFLAANPDEKYQFHCVLESWFAEVGDEERVEVTSIYDVSPGSRLWCHHDHSILGPLFARGGLHVWKSDGENLEMVAEGFRSWVS